MTTYYLGSNANNAIVEAVALIVQIHLQQNRTDLALKEVMAAKKWAQDNLLINIAESWVGLRVVRLRFDQEFKRTMLIASAQGGEKYQEAFYVFEEMAQAGSSSQGLLSQAIAEIHLGRFEEAESALQQALAQFPDNADVLANCAVLASLSGKDNSEYLQCVTMRSLPRGLLTHCEELFKLSTQRTHTSKDLWRRTSYLTQPRRSSKPARSQHNKSNIIEALRSGYINGSRIILHVDP